MRTCDSDPLLSAGKELQDLLAGVCQLMAVQELVGEVGNRSDLHAILEQNVLDSCHWVGIQSNTQLHMIIIIIALSCSIYS